MLGSCNESKTFIEVGLNCAQPERSALDLTPVHTHLTFAGSVQLTSKSQLSLFFIVNHEDQSSVELIGGLIEVNRKVLRDNFTGEVSKEGLFAVLLLSDVVLEPSNHESWFLGKIDQSFVVKLRQDSGIDLQMPVILSKEVNF